MRNKTKLAVACGAILLTTGICAAQGEGAKSAAEQPKYFHLDFVVKELESGKVINARHYSTTVATGDSAPYNCTMRTGSKVPVPTGTSGGNPTQFQYIDVGVNIDCRAAKEIDGSLAISVTAEISNAAASSNPPLIRQTKWSSNVIVPIGKPTVIFSSDDVTTKGQMQLELTATAITAR
jgi:hypothetical protein